MANPVGTANVGVTVPADKQAREFYKEVLKTPVEKIVEKQEEHGISGFMPDAGLCSEDELTDRSGWLKEQGTKRAEAAQAQKEEFLEKRRREGGFEVYSNTDENGQIVSRSTAHRKKFFGGVSLPKGR